MGPISSADIQKYQDPYTNDVINATQADFDTQNQRANSTVTGNAAAQGALGGDRVGVAQALTAEGQARVQAPVIAGLRSSGYQQAVNTAENQQKFDLTAQQAAMQGAGQQVGAGTLQQTTQQNQDTQARQDYYQQQGYPFQVAQWLASIDTGVGGSMGSSSTSTGVTQGPTPNPWTQAAGLGLTAASIFAKDGGRIKRAGFAAGGMPWAGSDTWVPTANIHAAAPTAHANLPSAPPTQKAGLSPDQMKGIGVLGKDAFHYMNTGDSGVSLSDLGSSSAPLAGLDAGDYQGYGAGGNQMFSLTGANRGGRIRRYASGGFADGGSPDFSDRFDAAFPNMAAGVGASRPAFEDVGPTYDDGAGPLRLSAPEDLDAWRGRVDRDNGRKIGVAAKEAGLPPPTMVASAPDEVPSLPSEVTSGVSKRRMTASAAPADTPDEGTEALGYAGAPKMQPGVGAPQNLTATEQEKPGGILNSLGIKMSPELRQGLMQAGLSMMATTRGGPGSFLGSLGEAGMVGVGGYEKSQQAALKQAQTEREQAIEAEKLRMTQETHQQQTASTPILSDGTVNPAWVKMKEKEAEISNEPKTPFGWTVNDDGSITPQTGGPADPDYAKKLAEARAKIPFGWQQDAEGNVVPIPNGPADPAYIKQKSEATTKGASLADEDARSIAQYTVATGDDSRVRSLGFNPQNKALVQKYINQEMRDKNVSDSDMATRKQEFSAEGISKNAAARTRSTREENLNMILKATTAAIPAALEESEKVKRYTGLVPLDKIIQNGQVVTNDPNLITFGMANLQLAEHWARAMNPMGVMRESDRDLALHYLNTALSKDTYKTAVLQLQKQVTRERDAIHEGKTTVPQNGQPQPGEIKDEKAASTPAATHPANAVGTKTDVNGVKWYVDKDGKAISKAQ